MEVEGRACSFSSLVAAVPWLNPIPLASRPATAVPTDCHRMDGRRSARSGSNRTMPLNPKQQTMAMKIHAVERDHHSRSSSSVMLLVMATSSP